MKTYLLVWVFAVGPEVDPQPVNEWDSLGGCERAAIELNAADAAFRVLGHRKLSRGKK